MRACVRAGRDACVLSVIVGVTVNLAIRRSLIVIHKPHHGSMYPDR